MASAVTTGLTGTLTVKQRATALVVPPPSLEAPREKSSNCGEYRPATSGATKNIV